MQISNKKESAHRLNRRQWQWQWEWEWEWKLGRIRMIKKPKE